MDDKKPFKHGQEGTHSICDGRLTKQDGKMQCCVCEPHKDCDLYEKKKRRINNITK